MDDARRGFRVICSPFVDLTKLMKYLAIVISYGSIDIRGNETFGEILGGNTNISSWGIIPVETHVPSKEIGRTPIEPTGMEEGTLDPHSVIFTNAWYPHSRG